MRKASKLLRHLKSSSYGRATSGILHLTEARWRRWRSNGLFIAVTGSSGKTTTTALLSHILAGEGPVHAQVGDNAWKTAVRTLRRLPAKDCRYVVCEIGTSGPGMIGPRVDLIKPSVGIVTLVGLEHYSAFRGYEAVAEEKGTLIEKLPPDGLALLNHDDPRVAAMAARSRARVITFGGPGADYACEEVRASRPGELQIRLSAGQQVFDLRAQLTGAHQSLAILAAVACAHQLGVDPTTIQYRIASFEPIFGRCSVHVLPGGPIFIADSMKAPFGTLTLPFQMMGDFEAPRKRIVVGQISDYAGNPNPKYRDAYRSALAAADEVIFVGPHSHRSSATKDDVAQGRFHRASSVQELSKYIKDTVIPGEIILLKSAVSLHLERLILDWETPVRCWAEQCGKKYNCLRCGHYKEDFVE